MPSDDSRLFVGTAQTSWWKFRIAGIVWTVLHESSLARYAQHVPGAERAVLWAFEVRVLSRDMEVADGE